MNGLLAIAGSAIVIVPIVLWLLLRRKPSAGKPLYLRQSAVLSPEQRALYQGLREALGEHYVILPKVPVGDLITEVDGTLDGAARAAFEELAAQPFAFVLCHPVDLSVVAAISLTGRGRGVARESSPGGISLRAVCEAAGLPLVTIAAAPLYESAGLRETVLAALQSGACTDPIANCRREPRISSLDDLDLV